MLTTIKCHPARYGRLRAWTIVQIAAGSRREISILAATGREAIRQARALFDRAGRPKEAA